MSASFSQIPWKPLYRQLWRASRALPDETTSAFFIEKARRDFRSSETAHARWGRTLRQLRFANAGYLHSIKRAMELAHGRRGKLAKAAVGHLISETRKPGAEQLLADVPRTKLPNYTPRLRSHITSGSSFAKGKPATLESLALPYGSPSRADTSSKDANVLGPLHRRRMANIHWRALASYRSRMIAPISHEDGDRLYERSQTASIVASPAGKDPWLEQEGPVRDKRAGWVRPKRITSRFMKRRYYGLLQKSVLITERTNVRGKVIHATQSPTASPERTRKAKATPEDLSWVL